MYELYFDEIAEIISCVKTGKSQPQIWRRRGGRNGEGGGGGGGGSCGVRFHVGRKSGSHMRVEQPAYPEILLTPHARSHVSVSGA